MKPLQILSYVAVLAIGALITWSVMPKGTEEKRVLEQQIKNLTSERDSILKREAVLLEREGTWSRIDKMNRDSIRMARVDATKWNNEYKKVLRAPVIRYSEPRIDSAVNAIIGLR